MKKTASLVLFVLALLCLTGCGVLPRDLSPAVPISVTEAPEPENPFSKTGNTVTFGRYEQDGNDENGPEPIEWTVLEAEDEKALLISKYALDSVPYHTEDTGITWENCSLRAWLNSDFIGTAFTPEEQNAILVTDVDNGLLQCFSGWPTSGGNNTRDRIFLLSCAEAFRYFNVRHTTKEGADQNVAARVSPTAYAVSKGAWFADYSKTAEGGDSGMWWLRSPGSFDREAAIVYHDGSLSSYYASGESFCVRPAFWISLELFPR